MPPRSFKDADGPLRSEHELNMDVVSLRKQLEFSPVQQEEQRRQAFLSEKNPVEFASHLYGVYGDRGGKLGLGSTPEGCSGLGLPSTGRKTDVLKVCAALKIDRARSHKHAPSELC